jgi:pyrophosphatase PpaX
VVKNITTILFDIDGTLLDTREFILQAFEYALRTHDYEVPGREEISAQVGKHLEECYVALAGSKKSLQKLIQAHKNFQDQNFHLSIMFPGVRETLEYLRGKGYKIAAVTTRYKRTALQTLQDADILELFDAVIYGDDVAAVKPDPEPLLKALQILTEKPEHAVMVGDSHLDIEGGKNTGTRTIRATYGFHKDRMHEPEPDYFIEDIRDLLKIL